MALRYFPGKTQAWLEARLATILDDQASGKTHVAVTAGDVSAQALVQQNIQSVKAMILADLSILDPTTYPIADIVPPTRTKLIVAN
jgi:hypothetical protein